MKHPILLLFWALIISPAVLSQNTARINEYAYIVDINNIKVSLDPTGSIGYSTTQPYYFNAPADSSTTAMYGSFFWLAGKNQYGETKAFTPDWYLNESEVHFGPYNYNYTNYLAAEYNLLYAPYNRVWMVTASEIQTHQQLFNSENYSIPEAILNWPGNGDTLSGFNAQLAPFVDRNNNLIYEPLAGDYPLIKGDAAIFAMYHDNSFYENEIAINGNTNTEIHVLLYAYAGDQSTLIGNTIFVDYTIYNCGDFIFDSLYAGTFVDFAIGDFQDDYCGSDSALNLFFGYNGDLSDGPSLNTYTTLPALGCMPLSHQLNSFMHFNGDNTAAGILTMRKNLLIHWMGNLAMVCK
ncbi:MAG: hypothetical protein IPO24_00145 [Bacteroidetes bacterium]|nr:hypothetical protein [Bacteroidota bacterium]